MSITENTTLSRRTFVKGSAAAGLGAVAGAGALSMFGCTQKDPDPEPSPEPETKNTPLAAPEEGKCVWGHCAVNCETRCALKFHIVDDEVAWVESDNTGDDVYGNHQLRACQRGRSIRRWINNADRLNYPMKRTGKRGEGEFERISWDEAFTTIAEQYTRIVEAYGPESIFSQYASGVCDSNISGWLSRFLKMKGGSLGRYGSYSSAQISQALPWLYGTRAANGNSDIINSKLVVMFGDNTCETKQAGAGPTYHLMHALEEGKARVIVIDPRLTDTAAARADQWIPIRPGTDAALCDACAFVMISEGLVNTEFIETYTTGFDEFSLPTEAMGQHKSYKDYILGNGEDMTPKTPDWAAAITGVSADVITALAREMATTAPCAIYQGKGPQRHGNGEQTARAICMMAVLTGNVGINGGNTGSDLDSYYMPNYFSIPAVSGTSSTVKESIASFTWTDAVERGEEMTATADGVRGGDKLKVGIKMIWNYAGNCMTNQHGDINHTHEVLQDESKCEFIVLWDTFLTDSARYADILLPDLMAVEQPNIISSEYAGNMAYTLMGDAITSAKFERKTLFQSLSGVADKMGLKDAYTEGKTELEWLRQIYTNTYNSTSDTTMPDFDTMMEMGFYKKNCPEGEHVALEAFRKDPVANKLNTPSGKIEIYSQALMDKIADWTLAEGDYIHALPVYCPEVEGYNDPLSSRYPLQMTGFHFKGRTHSSYGCIDTLKQVNPQELWINPVDANARGIKDGDKVLVYNDRGKVEITANVTPRIMPGVTAMGQGAWHDADMFGDQIDHGGCINTLTSHRPTPYAKANPQHTNLVEVKLA